MANFFLTDANGNKRGPYNEQQLQSGIAKGIITPTTPLETDTGHKGLAGQIPGLFPAAPPQQPRPVPVPHSSTTAPTTYRHIALVHRQFIVSFGLLQLAYVPMFVLDGMGNQNAFFALCYIGSVLLLLAALIFFIFCMVRVAKSLHYATIAIVLFVICAFFPCINLITLLFLNSRAVKVLKQAGYRVGLLGADMRQFDDDN